MKTKMNNKSRSSFISKEEKALNLFADMMIEKIEKIEKDWEKPWFTECSLAWPRNLSNREYNGMNALMLLLHCENKNYKTPVFLTYKKCFSLNFKDTVNGRVPAVDADGNKLPWVHVLKEEKSFPVFLTTFTVVGENGQKIKYEDYKNLSDDEKSSYKVYPATTVYDVFNIEQTNIADARPELYNKLLSEHVIDKTNNDEGLFVFPSFDSMIDNDKWLCPVKIKKGDAAFYSLSKDEIVLPEKRQFKYGESFYSTAFHECIHSTGSAKHLNRFSPDAKFGSSSYAKEELIAELGAALTAKKYGFLSCIKEESASYLKSWLKVLKEDPSFIRTVLLDVKRATSILTQHIDALS